MFDLTGKVAIVTGAGSGIGRGIALVLARAGADVLAADIDAAAATETSRLVGDLGRRADAVRADVRDADALAAMAATAERDLGGLDICVANAGIGGRGSVLTLERDVWDGVIGVNLTGAFLTVQVCARAMVRRNRGGRIILVASAYAERASPTNFAYCASKAGVRMMARCWAQDLAPYGITVNSIGPGWTDTPLVSRIVGEGEDRRAFERAIPAGRLGTPEDIGHLACWLASDEAAYATGGFYLIDGGVSDRDEARGSTEATAARWETIRARRATASGDELMADHDQPA